MEREQPRLSFLISFLSLLLSLPLLFSELEIESRAPRILGMYFTVELFSCPVGLCFFSKAVYAACGGGLG